MLRGLRVAIDQKSKFKVEMVRCRYSQVEHRAVRWQSLPRAVGELIVGEACCLTRAPCPDRADVAEELEDVVKQQQRQMQQLQQQAAARGRAVGGDAGLAAPSAATEHARAQRPVNGPDVSDSVFAWHKFPSFPIHH